MILLNFYMLGLLGLGLGLADPIPAPTPPWVAPVPDHAHWIISVTYEGAKGGSATSSDPQLKQMEVRKTGNIKNDTMTYSNGTHEDYWYIGTHTLQPESFDNTKIIMDDFAADPNGGKGSPIRSLGFTGFTWVNGNCFDKVVTYENEVCYHYVFTGEHGVEAWTNVKDKMPVAYCMDGILYVYTFETPPANQLALPPACQKIIDAAQKKASYETQLLHDLSHH